MKTLSFTQQGQRQYQEDSLYCNPEIGLYMVCDGVGGATKGDVASKLVIHTIAALVEKESILPIQEKEVQQLVDASNQALHEKVIQNPEMEGMGTTLTLLYMHKKGVTVAHIGDSRVYFIRPSENKYWRTKDHSLVQELLDSDVLQTEEAMETHPMRNRITRALQGKTNSKSVKADVQIISNLKKGDLFFLCSDGVLEPYSVDSFIPKLVDNSHNLENRFEVIKSDCLEKSKDNNTCILIELKGRYFGNKNEKLNLEWRTIPTETNLDKKKNPENTIKIKNNWTSFLKLSKWKKWFSFLV